MNIKFKRIYHLIEDLNFLTPTQRYWFLGIMAADGHIHKVNKSFFSITQKEKEILIYIKKILQSEYPLYEMYNKVYNRIYYKFAVTSREIVSYLANWNIDNDKTYKFNVPSIFWDFPLYFIKSFVRGFIEGDGSITIQSNKKGFRYIQFSLLALSNFMMDLLSFFNDNGFSFWSGEKNEKWIEIQTTGRNAEKLISWLYDDKNLNDLYKGNKYNTYIKSKTIPKEYHKYDIKKKEFMELFQQKIPILQISQQIGIPFQTLYKWRNKLCNMTISPNYLN